MEKNIKIAVRLAEEILLPIHAKLEVILNPRKINGWVGAKEGIEEWEANSWKINIVNSDFGPETINISDHLKTDVVLMAQDIACRAYEKLSGGNQSPDMTAYIYANSKLWAGKLSNLAST